MIRPLALAIMTLAGMLASAPAGNAGPCDIPRSHSFENPYAAKPQIDLGFNLLYGTKFAEARSQFQSWQESNPCDPLGYIAMAAGYLFEEFHEQNVLTSDFFLDDKRLFGGAQNKPDKSRTMEFEAAIRAGKELALKHLNEDPRNANALFALTIASGLQADFEIILTKRQMRGLSLIKESEDYAKRLLESQPENADALLSLGATNYIIGSLPAYKRFFLWFGRIRGDKRLGMEQLQTASEKGHYLKPLAAIFLALAAMRENQDDLARSLLRDLVARFPENPIYKNELDRLADHQANSKNGGH
jgi:hypothetical protein